MPEKRYLSTVYSLIALAVVSGVASVTFLIWMMDRRDTDPIKKLDAEVVGSDYRLHFRYPGKDRVLHTQDDLQGTRNLYVPVGAVVRLQLSSLDYIYTVEVPTADVYEVAVPDLVFDAEFVIPQIGEYELLGSQMCGYDHPGLVGQLIVQSESEFLRTMNRLAPASAQVLQ